MLMKVNVSRSFNVIEAAAAISPATCQEPRRRQQLVRALLPLEQII
jgi:hypothetical protein